MKLPNLVFTLSTFAKIGGSSFSNYYMIYMNLAFLIQECPILGGHFLKKISVFKYFQVFSKKNKKGYVLS